MAGERITTAAGGIVWRNRQGATRPDPRVEVLIVHRPSYDDWTFPKGKTDPGEQLQTTAVREIAEEAGIRVRLGHPLQDLSYAISGGTKIVSYWCARALGTDENQPFVPNKEVDEVRWVSMRDARKFLTYQHDRDLLETFKHLRERQAHRTRTLIVLRHGKAVPRSSDLDDLERPLTSTGAAQANALIPLLGSYGIRRVVSSPAVRCTQTVEPYAQSISTFLEIDDRLSEDTKPGQVQRSLAAMMDRKKPVVLSTHRPTLPWVFEAIGTDLVDLSPGQGVVVHHYKGEVLATEFLA